MSTSGPPSPPSPPSSLTRRLRLTRTLLPVMILLVVVIYETLVARLGTGNSRIAHLAFYGLVGPLATIFTLSWITDGARAREEAERRQGQLYEELRESSERMSAVQALMRSVASAPDPEAVMQVAARGAVQATGSTHARISLEGQHQLGGPLVASAAGETLLASPSADLKSLTVPIRSRAGSGQLDLYFEVAPSEATQALAQAIGAEVGAALSAAEGRSRDLVSLFEVDQSIRAERNLRRLLARVTSQMAGRVNAPGRAAYLTDSDGVLRLEYARDDDELPTRSGGPVPPFVRAVAAAGVPLVADLPPSDGHGDAAGLPPGTRSVLGLPMLGDPDDSGLIGVLLLFSPQPGAFAEVRLPILALLASQASLAVRNARAYLHSEEVAIGEERSRIAREIHDGVAQSLAFCAIKLDVIERLIGRDPAQAASEVRAASNLLREQIREVRRSIFALRPLDLERYGLLETVQRYVNDFGEQNRLRVSLDIGGTVNLSPGDEAVVFRILQESLNNVAKHAGASNVEVRLYGGAALELSVQDDGRGFDPAAVSGRVSSAGGLGLAQMGERAAARGGSYRVASAPGQGTRIEVRLPQEQAEGGLTETEAAAEDRPKAQPDAQPNAQALA